MQAGDAGQCDDLRACLGPRLDDPVVGESFAQLLHDPSCRRVLGHVQMHNTVCGVFAAQVPRGWRYPHRTRP